jgi:crotonobetainyl-CoA:carnitine CoA-transferase CaiB-like acyl-CoA transferase
VPISVVDLPLASVYILESAQGDREPFRGKLRAKDGAQVFTVDLPSGDLTRHRAPFADDQPDPEGGLADLHPNTAKRSITLGLGCRAGLRLFEALL